MLRKARKLRQKLILEGNFKLYLLYGFGEIMWVMIGILLALFVNNWNAERKKHHKERAILQQLYNEFLDNKQQLAIVKKGHLAAFNDAKSVIRLFPIDPLTANLDSLNFYFFNADDGGAVMDRWTFNPSNAIISSIINSASFDIIQSQKLRIKLLAWDGILEDYVEDEKAMINYRNDILVPYLLQNGVMTEQRFKRKNLDLSFLASPQFESIITERYRGIRIIAVSHTTGNELETLEATIDEIIKLTSQEY